MTNHFEDDLSIEVANYLTHNVTDIIWWHTPNGGRRNVIEAARLKRMGVLAGVPDFTFIFFDNSIGFIELKLEKNIWHGKTYQSKVQKEFEREYRDLVSDAKYAVCRSVQEVRETLIKWQSNK